MKPSEGSTVISKSVVIQGQISGSEDLYIDGRIEGSIELHEGRLTIGPNAYVKADVQVRDAVIHGHVEGDVHASGRIEMRQSAVIIGDLYAARLSVEENATIQGRVELIAGSSSASTGAARVAGAPQQASLIVEENQA